MSALTTRDFERYRDLPSLTLDGCDSLAVLEQSPQIEILHLQHFPKVRSLSPLSSLIRLRALSLHSTPAWDGTNRHLLVESFEPLVALRKLELISILGVVPERGRLESLSHILSLQKVAVGNTNFYQLEDFAALSVSLPRARDSLQPVFQMNFVTICHQCQSHSLLFLAGAKPRSPRYVCPSCGRKKIVAHLERWNRAGGLPRYDSLDQFSTSDFIEKFGNPYAK